jgi:hypothetical protein
MPTGHRAAASTPKAILTATFLRMAEVFHPIHWPPSPPHRGRRPLRTTVEPRCPRVAPCRESRSTMRHTGALANLESDSMSGSSQTGRHRWNGPPPARGGTTPHA